jgi:dTDP-glucose 4,6-dehydratase
MSKNLLITGAAGFIGANFAHYWAAKHPQDQLVAYDALTYAGNLANLESLRGKTNFTFKN